MVLDIDHSKWEAPRNRLPQRSHLQSDLLVVSARSHRGIASLILELAPYGQKAHTRRMVHDPRLRPAQRCDKGA